MSLINHFSLVAKTITTCTLIVSTVFISGLAQASWSLDGDNSSLYYVTSKAASVSEVNSFGALSGGISDEGRATVTIQLASVDTAIEIRNERMREILFQVSRFPLASVSIDTDAEILGSLTPGESRSISYEAVVELNGVSEPLELDLLITGQQDGGLLVTLSKPLIVHANTFGLAEGVEELREIAGLPSINNNVVIDFTLQFDKMD